MKKIVSVMCLILACLSISAASHVKNVTAIGEVLGDGAKTTAVAIEYDAPIDGNSLSTNTYTVDGRTVKRVYTNSRAMKARHAQSGKFVIVELKTTVSLVADFDPDKKSADNNKKEEVPTLSEAVSFCKGKILIGVTNYKDYEKEINALVKATGTETEYFQFDKVKRKKAETWKLPIERQEIRDGSQKAIYHELIKNGVTAFVTDAPKAFNTMLGSSHVIASQTVSRVYGDGQKIECYNKTSSVETTFDLVKEVIAKYPIDTTKIYITGLSMGCMMTYLLMSSHPKYQ